MFGWGGGASGDCGWTPQLGVVADGLRRVLRVLGWQQNVLAPVGTFYVGPAGFVGDIASGVDVRGSDGATGAAGDSKIVLDANYTTNSSGVLAVTVPAAALRFQINPTTAGEFLSQRSRAGNILTITFRKFKTGGLGITLGTLLSVSVFEDSPGVVNFDLLGTKD